MKKRILCILLALCITLSVVPMMAITVSAANEYWGVKGDNENTVITVNFDETGEIMQSVKFDFAYYDNGGMNANSTAQMTYNIAFLEDLPMNSLKHDWNVDLSSYPNFWSEYFNNSYVEEGLVQTVTCTSGSIVNLEGYEIFHTMKLIKGSISFDLTTGVGKDLYDKIVAAGANNKTLHVALMNTWDNKRVIDVGCHTTINFAKYRQMVKFNYNCDDSNLTNFTLPVKNGVSVTDTAKSTNPDYADSDIMGSDVKAIIDNWSAKVVKPTRSGYAFTGWYSDAACTTAFNFDAPIKTHSTAYAGWKQVVASLNCGGTVTYYDTLDLAVKAANAATVDCELTIQQSYSHEGGIILQNANGKVITFNTGDEGTVLTMTATVNKQNLIEVKGTVSFTGNGGMILADCNRKTSVSVIYAINAGQTIKVYDGFVLKTINGDGCTRMFAVWDGPKAYIYGGKFLCPKEGESGVNSGLSTIVNANSYVYIYDGEFHWDITGANNSYWFGLTDSYNAKEYIIYGGYFDGPVCWGVGMTAYTIYGGKFTSNLLKTDTKQKGGTNSWDSQIGTDKTVKNINETYNGTTYLYEVSSNVAAVNLDTGNDYSTLQAAINGVASGQTVRMVKDLAENVSVASGQSFTLDLSGHVLKSNADSVPTVKVYGNLTVEDSCPAVPHYFDSDGGIYTLNTTATASTPNIKTVNGGIIYGAKKIYDNNTILVGNIQVYSGARATVNAGNIVGGSSLELSGGGVVVNSGGTFVLSGTGNVEGNAGNDCAAICNLGTFYMTGGTVQNNSTGRWGQIGNMGTVIMTGGSIKNNKSTQCTAGIRNADKNASLYLLGGEIINNTSGYYQVCPLSGVLGWGNVYLGGNINITGNPYQIASGGSEYKNRNLSVCSDITLKIGDGTNKYTYTDVNGQVQNVPVLTEDASVGIYTQTLPTAGNPVAFTDAGSAAYASQFFSDDDSYAIGTNGTQLVLAVPSAVTVNTATNGTASAEKTTAVIGDKVTVTVTPNSGYVLDTLTYTPAGGSATAITKVKGEYSFTMPATAVTVNATFVEIPDAMKNATYAASLTLSKNIDVNLAIGNIIGGVENMLSVVVESDTVNCSLDDGFATCVLKAVEAKDIDESIHIAIIYDGVTVKDFDYSVKSYCDAVYKHASYGAGSALGKLCSALLNYGKYAEDYANGNTESTLNEGYELDLSKVSLPESKKVFTANKKLGAEGSGACRYS